MSTPSTDILSQETEIQVLEALLPYVQKSFVDVGAEKGVLARFLAEHGLKGICLEPLPKHAEALTALASTHDVRHLSYAADEQDGDAEFYLACDDKGQPLDFFHSLQPLQNDSRVKHQQKLRVKCRSLASLCAEGLIEKELGVLKIDTEGNDLRVLRGAGPVRADVVLCEFFTEGIYNGWEEAAPGGLIVKAQQLGYEWWIAVRRRDAAELVSLGTTSFLDREWGNLIFMRKPVFEAARDKIGALVLESEERLLSLQSPKKTKMRNGWLARMWRERNV
jgi:FkbM family methyltransferase